MLIFQLKIQKLQYFFAEIEYYYNNIKYYKYYNSEAERLLHILINDLECGLGI